MTSGGVCAEGSYCRVVVVKGISAVAVETQGGGGGTEEGAEGKKRKGEKRGRKGKILGKNGFRF